MTIADVVRGRPTLDQYEVLMKADRMFEVGRYFGGQLTPEQIEKLTPMKKER